MQLAADLRRRLAPQALPFPDLPALRGSVRRTAALRASLALVLLALLAWALLLARDRDVRVTSFFPPDRTGIAVLDMSASVSPLTYRRMGRALARIAAANEPVGVIVFSDSAYELLHPGTPGSALEPVLRLFTPVDASGPAYSHRFPPNPWAGSAFQAGTRISEGLRLAGAVLTRDRVDEATVLLVSDLEVPSSDELRVAETVAQFGRDGYDVRIVPLFPQPERRAFFEALVGAEAFVSETSLAAPVEADEQGLGGRVPWLFVGAAVAVALALAANELACGRLRVEERP